MNVLLILALVAHMPPVTTVQGASPVPVSRDTVEMGLHVMVSLMVIISKY